MRNLGTWKKTCHFAHHKSHTDTLGREPGLPRWEAGDYNGLNHCTASVQMWMWTPTQTYGVAEHLCDSYHRRQRLTLSHVRLPARLTQEMDDSKVVSMLLYCVSQPMEWQSSAGDSYVIRPDAMMSFFLMLQGDWWFIHSTILSFSG
jgi:hypothetical protein